MTDLASGGFDAWNEVCPPPAHGPDNPKLLTPTSVFLFEEVVTDERNIVEGDGDRRIGRHRNRLRADSANLDVVAGKVGFREREVGHFLDEIWPPGDLLGLEFFLRERRNRDRHLLDIFGPLLRGDDDRFDGTRA